jgi:hypothetical protein
MRTWIESWRRRIHPNKRRNEDYVTFACAGLQKQCTWDVNFDQNNNMNRKALHEE